MPAKAKHLVRVCGACGTHVRGPANLATEAAVKEAIEASRKAHARTKAGRACPTQIKHRLATDCQRRKA